MTAARLRDVGTRHFLLLPWELGPRAASKVP